MQQTDFADSFIKGMLGWIRWIASSIANVFQSGSGRSGDMSTISWFADNWIKILIGLIVVGVLVDWLVWMARWRPYWVWFRRRRILLDNDVEGIDDDDLMLHYGDMATARARRDALEDDSLDMDDLDDDQSGDYDIDDLDEDDDYRPDRNRARRNAEDEEDGEDAPEFDELYDDRNGDYASRDDEEAGEDDEPAEEPEDPDEDAPVRGRKLPREAKRRGLFKRPRKKADAEEDPFSVEGDFFDDLGEDPMDDIVSSRVRLTDERNAQDTSVYQRPRLLPGDEPGAVRGADEEEGWHSGYTQRSAERGRRRKRDIDA